MEVSEKIALAALAVSLGSLFLAFLGYLGSRKALKISEHEVAERKLPLIVYLIDRFSFYRDDEKFCSFAVSYTNQSSSPVTFTSLLLEVGFIDSEQVTGKAVAEPRLDVDPPGISYGYKKLEIPVNLPSKETVTGWVSFKLPDLSARDLKINSYRIIGRSPDGREAEQYAYLLRSVKGDSKNETR